jgi:hypothetical protein
MPKVAQKAAKKPAKKVVRRVIKPWTKDDFRVRRESSVSAWANVAKLRDRRHRPLPFLEPRSDSIGTRLYVYPSWGARPV